jgi:hypothetical protein
MPELCQDTQMPVEASMLPIQFILRGSKVAALMP